jgi:hypothetical protein
VNYHSGFLFASLMLAQHGGKYRKPIKARLGGATVYKKTVYLPVIQPDPLPLADRKRLLGRKMAAKKRVKKNA